MPYSHKECLWRLYRNPGIKLERPGFNNRATVMALARKGYVRLDPPERNPNGTEGYNPKAYLTDTGIEWVQLNPDKTVR